MTLLEINRLHKHFGGNVVLDGVTFAVEERQIHGVIGPNGAGKTTLFNIINGMYQASSGTVVWRGENITNKVINAVARSGIGRTFQVPRVFNEMTVFENMMVPTLSARNVNRNPEERADELLKLAKLEHLRDQPAVEISGGQKKLLEFVRTMMIDPNLILLDEPFNGITPALIDRLIDIVKTLNDRDGKTFLLISHEIPHITALCDIVTVLGAGRTIAQGTPAEVRENPAVIEAYLGQ